MPGPRPLGGSSGSIGSGAIPEDLFFVDTNALYAFGIGNPSRLKLGTVAAVENNTNNGYDYYQWDPALGDWRDANLIFQGPKGDNGSQGAAGPKITSAAFSGDDISFSLDDSSGFDLIDAVPTLKGEKGDESPGLITQFSIDPNGPWVDEIAFAANPDLYFYWRWSSDNGVTWSPNGVAVRATVTNLPNGFGWFDDGAGGITLKKGEDVFLSMTSDEVQTKRLNVINNLLKFGTSKTVYDVSENVLFKNNITNEVYHPVWQKASDSVWDAKVRRPVEVKTRYNETIGGFKPALAGTSVPAQLVITTTLNLRTTAFYVESLAAHTGCTLLVTQGGKTKAVFEDVSISAGENRINFSDTQDGIPFLDLISAQTFVITIRDANGDLINLRELSGPGNTGRPWWALDFTIFEDVLVLDERRVGGSLAFDNANGVFDVLKADNNQLGAVKIGSGLAVEPDGTVYSTVSGAIIKAVADEAGRLALPQIAQAYTCIQSDIEQVFYLDANEDPSVLGNWLAGGTTSSSVTGFLGKGDVDPRTGVIEAKQGDYTNDEITYKDVTTNVSRKLVIDNGVLYMEEI